MNLYFLEASVPLTKRYDRNRSILTKSPYPHVRDFTSHPETVRNLKDFEVVMKKHAAAQHCMLKGELTRDLVAEPRAGTTDSNGLTEFICLDVDGVEAPTTVDDILLELGVQDVSYILQWSASYGIENNALRCHIFMLLDKPVAAPLVKQWLTEKNLTSPLLSSNLGLTKTGLSLKWVLDVSTCQNDKLIYIAPPTLKGLPDPMGKTPRISLVKRSKDRLTFPTAVAPAAANKKKALERIAELRAAAGMPARKISYKMHGSTEVLVKPDVCDQYETKQERGFTYFNLNGGDSWGYYHPEGNPDFIYNFKDEPIYLTKELLPSYWASLVSKVNTPNSDGVTNLVFRDKATDLYHYGTYDAAADRLELFSTANMSVAVIEAKRMGVVLGDGAPPSWQMVWDPQSINQAPRVDPDNQVINCFEPSIYMKAEADPKAKMPKTIKKVIFHVLGSDQECYDRFINWLAYALQTKDRATVGWVITGTTGTGKSTLLNDILRPLFGAHNVAGPRMESLESTFNTFISHKLLVAVDEADSSVLRNEKRAMADLRMYQTDKIVHLRDLHRAGKDVRNYTTWIFFSNEHTPLRVTLNDRRVSAGKFQHDKLVISAAELERIETELQAFHDFLFHYPVDVVLATTVLENEERSEMMAQSVNSVDEVINALSGGVMDYFITLLPQTSAYMSNALTMNKVEDYKGVLKAWVVRTERNTGKCRVLRDEIAVLLRYLMEKPPESPNKVTSLLKAKNLHLKKMRGDWDGLDMGVELTWTDVKQWPTYEARLNPQTKSRAPLQRVK